MTALSERQQFIQWIAEAVQAGARQSQVCQMIGITARALQRCDWHDSQLAGESPALAFSNTK